MKRGALDPPLKALVGILILEGMGPETKMCRCGARYEVTYVKTMFGAKDTDSADCEVCGERLGSWSGSRMHVYVLVERPESEDGE